MRNVTALALPAAVMMLGFAGGYASAQSPFMQRQRQQYTTPPPISPYLGLLQRGGTTASNYFNIVRPQNLAQSNNSLLQQQINTNQSAIAGLEGNAALPDTGHGTGFMNYGGSFMNFGAGAQRGGGGGGRTGGGPFGGVGYGGGVGGGNRAMAANNRPAGGGNAYTPPPSRGARGGGRGGR